MSGYRPGEIVNITIRGARVERIHGEYLELNLGEAFELLGEDQYLHLSLPLDSAATVERGTPADWPPQLDDLWRDSTGGLWYRNRTRQGDSRMVNAVGHQVSPEVLLDESPVLVFRHVADPAASSEPRTWSEGDTIPADVTSVRDSDGDTWVRDSDGEWHLGGDGITRRTADLLRHYGPVVEILPAVA
jgi:hypothetical protein